jgi:hypothetical protein
MSVLELASATRSFLPPRTVKELSSIPLSLRLLLPPYLSRKADNDLYTDHARGVYDFFVEVVGPYGRLLNKAFPSCASSASDVSSEAKEFLTPHVGNFLSYLVRSRRLSGFEP